MVSASGKSVSSYLDICDFVQSTVEEGVVGWCKGVLYLRHWGVQLVLAYSWARPAILQVRVEGECFYFFLFFTFIPFSLSSLSLCFITSTISSISFLPFSVRGHKMTNKD